MPPPDIVNGRVHSGHFIYVRDAGALSDSELLAALGLHGYTPDRKPVFPCRCARILRAADWSAYADDWFYTAYNLPGIRDAVARLASRYEVLRTATGDSDESFEFYHFVDGSLCRGFHFHDYAGKSSILLDRGVPFRCESVFNLGSNPLPFVHSIADEVGIDSGAMAASVSTYSKPYQGR